MNEVKISARAGFITMSLVFVITIITKSFRVIFSSSVLDKSLNIVVIVLLSGFVGALIRELLLPKEK
ncbi:hypothetical protein [Paenibacillus sp. FSL P4-0081]|jgi:hypothetical protein|uniref:hypothetical protein n=1 Tax=Paenibacillus sp. FSL P4-0081 TaxID=1536769 RepID=UPI0012E0348F|nr:hypothetical protein [Paenibacillus sp. FSL P4-0081]